MKIRKMLALLSAFFVIATVSTGCTSEDSSSDSSPESVSEASEESSEAEIAEESSEEEASEEEAAKYSFEVAGTTLSTDYNGDAVLIVEYNFTNNSEDAISFTVACQDTAFQNGVECDSTVIGCDDYDSQEQMNDIQPGTTYAVHVGYHLQDTTSPVSIEITDLLGMTTLLEETITL